MVRGRYPSVQPPCRRIIPYQLFTTYSQLTCKPGVHFLHIQTKDTSYHCKKIPLTEEPFISWELSTFMCRNIQTYSCCKTRIPTALLEKQEQQYITRTDTLLTYISIRICELCSSITCQRIDYDDLSPFIHIHKKITQLPIIFMD